MKLLDYTPETGLMPRLDCANWSAAIEKLVEALVAAGTVTDAPGLVAEITRHETEGSTAIGGGLAIPHARFPAVASLQIAICTLAEPLDIPADDNQPVDVIFLLVGPDGDPRQILRILARLARLVKNGSFLADLRTATNAEQMRRIIARAEKGTG